jgi:hypothetical protein
LLNEMDAANSWRVALEAARRLASLIDGEGRFVYRYDATSGTVIEGYHSTRHAAAMWVLAIAARRLALPDLLAALRRAADWLIAHRVIAFGEARLPVVVEGDHVDLGGVALGLLALVELHRLRPAPPFMDLARKFGRHLLAQRRQDGNFLHRRMLPGGQASDHLSRYATGQALLALAELYRETGEFQFLEAALESESLLADADYGVSEQGHWMVYAIEALESVAPRAAHRAHGCRIAASILVYPNYRSHGKSTPIACYAEALAAYLRMLRARPAESAAIDSPSEALVRPALEQDLRLLMDYRLADGAFIEGGGVGEVQIDHIQHALAAFLGHALLFLPDSPD